MPEENRSEYRCDAFSRLTRAKAPNGLVTEYQYDLVGNITSITYDAGIRFLAGFQIYKEEKRIYKEEKRIYKEEKRICQDLLYRFVL